MLLNTSTSDSMKLLILSENKPSEFRHHEQLSSKTTNGLFIVPLNEKTPISVDFLITKLILILIIINVRVEILVLNVMKDYITEI